MLPRDKNGGALVLLLSQFAFKPFDFPVAELCIDRQPAANGSWLNGHQRTNIIVAAMPIHFLGWTGRKHELGPAIFCQQHIG